MISVTDSVGGVLVDCQIVLAVFETATQDIFYLIP